MRSGHGYDITVSLAVTFTFGLSIGYTFSSIPSKNGINETLVVVDLFVILCTV